MNDFPSKVKEKLNSIISEMSEHHWLFSKNPGHDFMRQSSGKLSFYDTMRIIIGMGKGSTSDEIMDYFNWNVDSIPSNSAFVQRRKQIALSAFEYLFSEFSTSFPQTTNSFKDHCILACDGTHVVYSRNKEILEDYSEPKIIKRKGFNHMHLNGLVDVNSKSFLDVVIQPGMHPDERNALHTMLNHFNPENPEKYIITADRGYESYNLIFHCNLKNFNYVFRVKAPNSNNSLLSSFINELPDNQEEFDVIINKFYTDKKTNIIKEQEHVYHYINPSKKISYFYELLGDKHLYHLQFRVLKIKVSDNSYEYIITNLPSSTFDINDIKDCYHARWGIEVTFRYLKHAAGLLYFHSNKSEYLKQEIYATLIAYNFGIFIGNEVAKDKASNINKSTKYVYEIDISTALKISRKYFIARASKHIDVFNLIGKYVHAVKIGTRCFERCMRGIGSIHFFYR